MATAEFAAAAKEVSDEMRAGAEIDTAEVADRLDLPVDFLIACAATWLAAQRAETVLVVPVVPAEGSIH
ncbi:hypothetical protein [Mesorhizobium sp. 113-3-9]|uniref:hypothetical protein n=1 Tax=Mesorhizobium sp. 113-3-9 TaxID=2744517 RepID=UPI001929230D|nr:hypothetical protein [Mesorhizobium sp. 113-3-9]